MTARQMVNAWLDSIGETDTDCRQEVLTACANCPEARAYYVMRFHQMERENG